MSARLLMAYRQRLTPPFETESEPVEVEVFQNAVVLDPGELGEGERLVFDRDELAEVVTRPKPRAA
jgi:hypothetical protein